MPDLSSTTTAKTPPRESSKPSAAKNREETFSSMLEMAGGAPPSLPSSHLDPNAFFATQQMSSSSFPSPSLPTTTHGQDPLPALSRASQGAALPINGGTRTGDDDAAAATTADVACYTAEPFQSHSQQSGSSLFSTATASTPIPFSSHPALQPHMPPLHFISTPDDAAVSASAGSLGQGWGWSGVAGQGQQQQPLSGTQSNGLGNGDGDGMMGGPSSSSSFFDLLGDSSGSATTMMAEGGGFNLLPAGLMGYATPSDPSPASLASAPASASASGSSTWRGSTSHGHGHGQGGGFDKGSRGSANNTDIDLVSRDPRQTQGADIPVTGPTAASSSSSSGHHHHHLPLPILASLIRAAGGDDHTSSNKSAISLPNRKKKPSAATGGPGDTGGGARGVSNDSGGGGGESSGGGSGNGNWGSGDDRSRSGSGPVRGLSDGSGGSGGGQHHFSGNGGGGSAGGGKRRRGNDDGDEESPAGSGSGAGENKRIVQRADKSCRKCRERRVRCDRLWPACERCHKRRESCEWAEGTNVDEIEEGGDAERIAALQAKVASLERQLKTAAAAQNARRDSGSGSGSGSAPVEATPPHPPPSSSSSSNNPRRPSSRHPNAALSGFASPSTSEPTATAAASATAIWLTIRDIWALRLDMEPEETETVLRYLAAQSSAPYAGQLNLGRSNVHWRLGEPLMAKVLTIHLLDAAVRACCSRLPGIFPLAQKIGEYKNKLDSLTPAEECSVAVLAALGARASPHSQLLGIDTVCLADGTPSPPMFLYAGERREMACRQLESRARELCWSHGFFEHVKIEHLDSTVGLVQLLIYEEIMPKQSRFFVRSALGLYFDIRYEDMEQGKRTSQDPRIGPGAALFLADATIAAACHRPSYISTSELDQYVITDGVRIPDFPGTELQTELERTLERPVTTEKLVDAMSTVMLWVAGCHRLFAQLTTARRPNAPSTLPLLKSLWKLVDKVHTAVQNLQQFFVGLSVEEVVDLEQDPFALEHYILMGVRYDSLLVDIVNLQHTYLMTSRKEGNWAEPEDDPLLLEMREESMLRVRKCLKLTAFYAQLYLQSQDKHLVHHMLMQLEMLPNWSVWATQRVGTPGGPISSEYELTEVELDWLQQALELSSYYTPKAAHRLELFAKARGKLSDDGPRTIEDLMRQSRGELRRPVAELESQYQNALVQNGTFDPTQQDPTTTGSPPQVPPTLQHVPVHDDPQRYFDVDDTSFAPSASETFIFDDYGVASIQGMPLAQQPPVSSLEFVQNGFRSGEHNSWMNLPSDFPTAVGNEVAREAESAEELTDRWLGGRSVGQ